MEEKRHRESHSHKGDGKKSSRERGSDKVSDITKVGQESGEDSNKGESQSNQSGASATPAFRGTARRGKQGAMPGERGMD